MKTINFGSTQLALQASMEALHINADTLLELEGFTWVVNWNDGDMKHWVEPSECEVPLIDFLTWRSPDDVVLVHEDGHILAMEGDDMFVYMWSRNNEFSAEFKKELHEILAKQTC